jgi:hypothetical protein
MQQTAIDDFGAPLQRMGTSPRKPVIIADGGDGAWVVVSDQPAVTRVGARFIFRGREWQIATYRRHARAYVARPVRR